MQGFSSWTLDTIRKEGSEMSWMEERRFDWVAITAAAIMRMVEAQTFLLITDREREWFARYTLNRLNRFDTQRPLLPIVSLESLFPHIDKIEEREQMQLLDDMLALSFSGGYTFFYIGKGSDSRAQIAKHHDESLLWLIDEQAQNSFYLNGRDPKLDIKMIQLLGLFDKSIDAILFNEVDLEHVI